MAVVKAPLVIAKNTEGQLVYLYQGTEVPSNITDDELERLADYFEGDQPKSRGRKPVSDN